MTTASMTAGDLATQSEMIPAMLRGAQRAVNHLDSLLEYWPEMTDDERLEAVSTALERLTNPY